MVTLSGGQVTRVPGHLSSSGSTGCIMMSKLIQKLLAWRKKRSGNTIGKGKLAIISSKTGICEVASVIAIGTRMITIKSAVTARLTAMAPVQ